jgi:hypothetical protein
VNAVFVLFLLVTFPNGGVFRESLRFDTGDECKEAILIYDEALSTSDWDLEKNGKVEALCKRVYDI